MLICKEINPSQVELGSLPGLRKAVSLVREKKLAPNKRLINPADIKNIGNIRNLTRMGQINSSTLVIYYPPGDVKF